MLQNHGFWTMCWGILGAEKIPMNTVGYFNFSKETQEYSVPFDQCVMLNVVHSFNIGSCYSPFVDVMSYETGVSVTPTLLKMQLLGIYFGLESATKSYWNTNDVINRESLGTLPSFFLCMYKYAWIYTYTHKYNTNMLIIFNILYWFSYVFHRTLLIIWDIKLYSPWIRKSCL